MRCKKLQVVRSERVNPIATESGWNREHQQIPASVPGDVFAAPWNVAPFPFINTVLLCPTPIHLHSQHLVKNVNLRIRIYSPNNQLLTARESLMSPGQPFPLAVMPALAKNDITGKRGERRACQSLTTARHKYNNSYSKHRELWELSVQLRNERNYQNSKCCHLNSSVVWISGEPRMKRKVDGWWECRGARRCSG